MTTEPKQGKNKPAFYIFLDNKETGSNYAGVAFRHKKGTGLDVLIGGKRYMAFEPKNKSEMGESA